MKTSSEPSRQLLVGRLQDELGDAIDEEERDEHARGDCQARADDAFPQFVQMLEKSHSAVARVIIPIAGHGLAEDIAHDGRF